MIICYIIVTNNNIIKKKGVVFMKRKLTALISALAVTAALVPSFVTVSAATVGSSDLGEVLTQYRDWAEASGDYAWDTENNYITKTAAVKVLSDMKATRNSGGTLTWKDKVTNNTYSAGTSLSSTFKFAYKTEIKMQSVLDEFDNVTGLAEAVIEVDCANDENTTRKETLLADLEKSYIKDAEFTITINNPNNMEIPNDVIYGVNMYGFTAVNGTDVIEVEDGKLTIVGDATDDEAGRLVYTEVSRLYENKVLTIKVKTEGKTSKKALAEALKYNLVLTCDSITAKAPNNYSSSASYKLIGDVKGNSPIYTSDAEGAKPIANITYDAVQDISDDTWFDSDSEISETVRITTDRRPNIGGGGGGGGYLPITTPAPTVVPESTPTPTLSPTFAPDAVVPVPEIFESADHYAYIIGYPEGDVRPENSISREEVVTIFFRLLTDESREKLFAKTNDLSDVEEGRWSNNAISTMSNGGYVTGYEDGSFKPGAPITRAEFVTLAVRFYEDVVAADAEFRDVTTHWAKKYVDKAIFYRLIDGYEDGTFRPDQNIKRCEVMKIVNTILNRHVDTKGLVQEAVDNNWIDNPESAWYYTEVFEATMTHDFEREEGASMETWTGLKANPNWVELEKTWTQTGTEENN